MDQTIDLGDFGSMDVAVPYCVMAEVLSSATASKPKVISTAPAGSPGAIVGNRGLTSGGAGGLGGAGGAGAGSRSTSAACPAGAVRPVPFPQNSPFGWRDHPILGKRKFHGGADFAGPAGTAILAMYSGTVVSAGPNGTWGNLVQIAHVGGYSTRYAHLQSFVVGAGDPVSAGDPVGFVGSTGRSTGPHLHLELLGPSGSPMNPTACLQ